MGEAKRRGTFEERKKMAIDLQEETRRLKNIAVEQNMILGEIQKVIDGLPVCDFSLSYPIVRSVSDLKQQSDKFEEINQQAAQES